MAYMPRVTSRGVRAYALNPSRSQSSPWACPDYLRAQSGYSQMCDEYVFEFCETPPIPMPFNYKIRHPFDDLLVERCAIIASERDAIEAQAKKDAAWWDERRRG